MDITVGKIVGRLTEKWWGQVHDFTAQEGGRGRLVAVISLRRDEGGDSASLVELGREVLFRLHELYFALASSY